MTRNRERQYYNRDWMLYLKCNKCWEFKIENDFYKDKECAFWRNVWCKDCFKDHSKMAFKEYYKNNKEEILKKTKKYYESNKEKRNEYVKKCNEKDIERYKSWCRKTRKKQLAKRHVRDKENVRQRTRRYVHHNNISFDECCICKSNIKIEMHHPDYLKPYDIVPCCKLCHEKIHKWIIDCPQTINLLNH